MREQKSKFAEGKFISSRSAGVLAENTVLAKAVRRVRRVLRDKSRAATERQLFFGYFFFVKRK